MSIDCGGVIKKELDLINDIKRKEIKEKQGKGETDYLPWCDLSVWTRECTNVVITPINGITTGCIPGWINGALIRNGPGSFTVGNSKFKHLFDGSALLHRFEVKDGKATYQCQFLQSNTLKLNTEAHRIVVTEFGTGVTPDPCHSIFKSIAAIFTPGIDSDNCMISVYPFDDELYSFSEYPVIHRIHPKTLESLGPVNISNYVNIVHHTSHPHVTEDGTVYNLGLSVSPTGPKYSIVKFPNTKKGKRPPGGDVFSEATIVASAPTRWLFNPGYMHTFGITESYFVLIEQPLSASIPLILLSKLDKSRPSSSNLKWFEGQNTLIHLISRESGKLVSTYWSDPFFYLHIINQYEEKNHVILDVCLYKNPSMIDCMYIEALESAKVNPDYANCFRGRPMRFVLPLQAIIEKEESEREKENLVSLEGSKAKAWKSINGDKICVSPELLSNLGCETPRINYSSMMGKKYRYFYAISSDVDLRNPGTIIKVDTFTKTSKTWSEEGTFPCEPIFVPKPNGQSEDEGILLFSILWSGDRDNKVALVVLDAQTMIELGRTTFMAPGPIPKCLHGWFTEAI